MARNYLEDLTRAVDSALYSGDERRIARALRAVQSARALVVRRFELSTDVALKRACLETSAQLQRLADRARRASS